MVPTIALVEDDLSLRENYQKALERDGYRVMSFGSRPEAEKSFAETLPDMAILDVMLGDEPEGGFELCRQLRSRSATLPIIFLSARDSDLDRVSGLRLGAWDYLSKSHTTLDYLPARISTLFKMVASLRTSSPPAEKKQENLEKNLHIDRDRKQVFFHGQQVVLTLTEFWLLDALTCHPGHVKSHEQLMDAANVVVTNNAITAHIRRIREKFREIDPEFAGIRTEYGMGYRWLEEA